MSSATRGPVVPGQGAGRFGPVQRGALVWEVGTTYARVRRLVRGRDLRDVVEALRGGAVAGRETSEVRRIGWRLAHVVQRTLGPLPFDSRCLMQSLVLTRMLARRGVRATVVVGVRASPDFRAHAWVEYDGRALLPPLDVERLIEI